MPLDKWKRRSRRRHKKGYSVTYTYQGTTFVLADEFKQLKLPKNSKTKVSYYNLRKAEKMILYLIKDLKRKYPFSKGYQILVNEVVEKGIDILITRYNTPVVAIEVTNYSEDSYIPEKDIKRYIHNLAQWNCKRKLVITYKSNLYNRKKGYWYQPLLVKYKIGIWIRPEQTLSREEEEELGFNLWNESDKN